VIVEKLEAKVSRVNMVFRELKDFLDVRDPLENRVLVEVIKEHRGFRERMDLKGQLVSREPKELKDFKDIREKMV